MNGDGAGLVATVLPMVLIYTYRIHCEKFLYHVGSASVLLMARPAGMCGGRHSFLANHEYVSISLLYCIFVNETDNLLCSNITVCTLPYLAESARSEMTSYSGSEMMSYFIIKIGN